MPYKLHVQSMRWRGASAEFFLFAIRASVLVPFYGHIKLLLFEIWIDIYFVGIVVKVFNLGFEYCAFKYKDKTLNIRRT